jgi:hypothetical protein
LKPAGWARPCENHFAVSCILAVLCFDTKSCRFKVCPALAQKYNVPYDVCATVAFLIEGDLFDHIVPDSVYYCEKLKVICTFPTLKPSIFSLMRRQHAVLPCPAPWCCNLFFNHRFAKAHSGKQQQMLRVTRHTSHAKLQSLVTVLINVTVTNATAAGEYELRLIPAPTMDTTDVEMPK